MAAVSPPPNVDPVARIRNLSQLGSSVVVDNDVPPRRYIRSGLEMEKMANIYLEEGNIEHAFILYTKLITLIVEKLPKHVHYKEIPATNKLESKQRVKKAFQRAEDLKESLKKRYEEEFEVWKVQEAERRKEFEREERERVKQQQMNLEQQIKESEHKKELERERLKKQNGEMNNRTIASAILPGIPSNVKTEPPATPPNFDLPTSPAQNYPKLYEHSEKSVKTSTVERMTPTIDRTNKPSWIDFVSGLRTLNVPTQLMRKFVEVASQNTRKNHETCGILTGKLRQNVFYITHLLIPKQTSTSDSCNTLNEEDIFVYQDSHDLITLGWIHTHPSQTAFMSSVDLHTHCSYQLMLPEALAIVCAPKHSQTGMFSLTNEYGLKFIAACKQSGFHPHPKEPPIYEDSGHVRLDESSSITVADLR